MLDVGDKIPKFALPDQTGKAQRFKDLVGRKGLVLYTYPKDNTSGCTVEAKEFTAELTSFRRRGYNVVGLSKDSVKSHAGFIAKQELKVPLLSDPDAELIQGLGAWGKKTMAGREYMGIIRATFVFDAKGKVLKAYPKVKAKGHAEQVLADLKEL
ncbi:MAG: peroxiredoxin [Deltaproteobacteria bacterium]|jgi:peroxiredoxin Q/BCP|nr:peroxiredoxin [Deltaproteobacteria bacterium]MBW2534905.1 peroxiredoxin [Deltaproteobacteria bacterium]